MANNIVVLKERAEREHRVALDPATAKRFIDLGLSVTVTPSAGELAYFDDEEYQKHGVSVADPTYQERDIILVVQPPTLDEIAQFKPGSIVVGLLNPYQNLEIVNALKEAEVSAIALELVPRITRAQSMDALSSQAAISGYQGALLAAEKAPRFFPMLTTAAGTIRPARVVVIGAGVAGLQAIATARRIGAEVEAYDIRSAAKGDVESLGAKLIDTGVDASGEGGYARELTEEEQALQAQALSNHLALAHAVISTAAIPGRRAPLIITKEMVERMPKGAVIIDLAAETGGNCELTVANEVIEHNGVTIYGPTNLPSQAAIHATEMYARNIYNLLSPFIEEGELKLDLDEEIIRECIITHAGEIRSSRIRTLMEEN